MSLFRDIAKLIRRLISAELAEVHTHLPCQVISYDSATNTCSLQPCLMMMRADDPGGFGAVQLPVLEDVPVQQIGSGKVFLSVAPVKDSYGLLHVSERSIAEWSLKGGVIAPGTARRFDLADGFFVPSLGLNVPDLPVPVATDRIALRTKMGTTYIAVVNDETIEIANAFGEVTIGAAGTVDVKGLNVVLMDGNDWAIQYTKMKTAFDKFVTDFNAHILLFSSHTHLGVPHATSTTGVAIPPGVSTTADMSGSKVATVQLP